MASPDSPQDPIDFLADLNAIAGIAFVHGTDSTLSATQLASAFPLSQSGAPSTTTYMMIPTGQNLPLLTPCCEPSRSSGTRSRTWCNRISSRYLVNWGYGDPGLRLVHRAGPCADPIWVLLLLGATTALGPDFISGTQQGIGAFASDLSA